MCVQCAPFPLERLLTPFQDVELYTCIVFISTSEPGYMLLFFFFFLQSFPFRLILSIQADNASDTHSDTQTRAAATSDMREPSESALQCINLGDKTGFSIINYLFSPFYLLFIPLCCIPLTVFVFYSFSHSRSAFSASPFSY